MPDKLSRAEVRKLRRKRQNRISIISLACLALCLAIVLPIALSRGDGADATVSAGQTTPAPPNPTGETPEAPAPDGTPEVTPESTPEPDPAQTPDAAPQPTPIPTPTEAPASTPVSFTISAVGDCTLGGDMLGPSEKRFHQLVTRSGVVDYEYCFKNVRDIFAEDDLTVANFEVVLTASKNYLKSDKSKIFIMRGRPEYAMMLPAGNIDVANIANNHINDFDDAGIEETIGHLEAAGVPSFGRERMYFIEIKGVRVGLVGFSVWTTSDAVIARIITDARAQCDVLIVSFHWGSELVYQATSAQRKYGRTAVDLGADLVLGHHPHVINGIEVYKGVNIVYSLGNFCFGGKENPADKDTFIYQHTFTVQDGAIIDNRPNIIPCKITSSSKNNNFQPTPAQGKQADDIIKKIWNYSKAFDQTLDILRP